MLHKIMLAHDGSNHADKALDLAITLAKATGSELEIVNVLSDQSLTQDELTLAETEYGTAMHQGLGDLKLVPLGGAPWVGTAALVETRPELRPTVRRVLGRRQRVKRAALDSTGFETGHTSHYYARRRVKRASPKEKVRYSRYAKLEAD